MNDAPDWSARAASEARDEQRRHPRSYPSTERERLEVEYTPDPLLPSKETSVKKTP